ncbi:hypothetical protein FSB84_23815 [Pseudobacter ginsenosidimutans]|uniref:FG-GAP-like repeat-containing protein n=1 Tax=Pseudobacter ginsenosidimutans TaxID=661488 RepID=UPI0011BB4BCE|nr:FG-GAP-like repeat-containing protein [Pseudobacter ginsenosidimutans]QEC44554.1 hypothetical protein FSB84_23815 [Pseudobacter ginsenosidimutans]
MSHFLRFNPGRFCLLLMMVFCSLQSAAQFRLAHRMEDASNAVREIHFFSHNEGYAAFHKWIGYTSDSGKHFIQKNITNANVNYNGYSVNLTFGFGIAGVYAFDKNKLLVYGDYGSVPAILYSTDGGSTFKLVHHTVLNTGQLFTGVTKIIFTSATTGYATEPDRIVKTTDGGQSWSSVLERQNGFFSDLQSPSTDLVFAFSRDQSGGLWLMRSDNAGLNWNPVTKPLSYVNHAFFISKDKGWVNARKTAENVNNNSTWYTSDGGNNWKEMAPETGSPFFGPKMQFVNDSSGYALSWGNLLYKTTDSGKVWEPLPFANGDEQLMPTLQSFFIRNEDQIWLGGDGHSAIALTANGGGITLPQARFGIDTAGYSNTGITKLVNYSKPNYLYKWFVNGVQISTDYHTTYRHHFSNISDIIELVVIKGSRTDTFRRQQDYPELPAPVVSSFSPQSGSAGTVVEIRGTGFNYVNAVSFGGAPAASFRIISSEILLAVVASGSSGNVTVSTFYTSHSKPGFQYYTASANAPVITGMSADFGNAGNSITLTGQNFGASAANNQVNFGSIKAVISSASSTQITVQVPAGAIYGPITVLNKTTSLSAASPRPFNVTFPDSSNFTPTTWKPALYLPISYHAAYGNIIGGDIDGDGKNDLLHTGSGRNSDFTVYLNTGTGNKFSFAEPVSVPMKSTEFTVAILKDLDGDGKPDFIPFAGSGGVQVARNTSTPGHVSFDNTRYLPGTWSHQSLNVDDLDGDGRPDLVAGIEGEPYLEVLRNTSSSGSIAFAEPKQYSVLWRPSDIGCADLDGDGKKEIITYSGEYATEAGLVEILRNTGSRGNISFVHSTEFRASGGMLNAHFIRLVDFDGDGKPDIILANDKNLIFYRNTTTAPGNFTFDTPITLERPFKFATMHVANFTGGKKADLALGGDTRILWAYKNYSTPGQIKQEEATHWETLTPFDRFYNTVSDFNGDNKPDLAAYDYDTRTFNFFENMTGVPITSRICTGEGGELQCDITGTNFQWQVNRGSGFVDLVNDANVTGATTAKLELKQLPASWNDYTIRCVADGRYSSIWRLFVAGSLTPGLSVSVPSTSFCKDEMVTFTATVTDAGLLPYLNWYINGELVQLREDLQFSTKELKQGDKVQVKLSSSEKCSVGLPAISNLLTMTQKGELPKAVIQPTSSVICSDSVVTFKAVVVNGGSNPSFQWKYEDEIVGGNSAELTIPVTLPYTYIYLKMTSNAAICNNGPVDAFLDAPVRANFNSNVSIKPSGLWLVRVYQ